MYQPESPFPFNLKNGAQITDERCTCGELRSKHGNTIAYGHGALVVDGVIHCKKFTWASWVYTTMNMIPGFERLDDQHVIRLERANRRNVGAKGWRYEIRDLSKGREHKIIQVTAPGARTKREALEHAKTELRLHVARRASLTVLDGGAQ